MLSLFFPLQSLLQLLPQLSLHFTAGTLACEDEREREKEGPLTMMIMKTTIGGDDDGFRHMRWSDLSTESLHTVSRGELARRLLQRRWRRASERASKRER